MSYKTQERLTKALEALKIENNRKNAWELILASAMAFSHKGLYSGDFDDIMDHVYGKKEE